MIDVEALRLAYQERRLGEAWELYQGRKNDPDPEWNLYGALTAWARRELWEAKRIVEMAFSLEPQRFVLGRLRFTAGFVYREIGDTAMALQHFTELQAGWGDYPDLRPTLEGPAHYNVGLVYYQRRDYSASVLSNQLAAGIFGHSNNTGYLRMTLQNLAWSLCCMGDVGGAIEALQEAEPLIDLDDTEAYWQQRIGYTFTCFADSAHEECIDMAKDIISKEKAGLDVLAHAAWLAGRSNLALGRIENATYLAKAAQDWAVECKDSRCLSDVQVLLREINEARRRQGA